MKRILITGKQGQVGWELQRTLASLGTIFAYDRSNLDLQNPIQICKTIREIQPHIIVNAAAYTAVDKAETDPEMANAVNATAPGILAEEAKKCGAILVHYSTDYVFDGTSPQPYTEADKTNPLNVYGKTKLEGEKAIQQISGKHLIFRTSWVYGARGKNFLLTMLKLGKERELLKIVNDQAGAPTWSRMIAEVTANILIDPKDSWGIYHLTSSGQTTWFEFAKKIFAKSQMGVTIQPISTSEYPLPAIRPKYSVLSNEKLKKTFQICLPDWEESLDKFYLSNGYTEVDSPP